MDYISVEELIDSYKILNPKEDVDVIAMSIHINDIVEGILPREYKVPCTHLLKVQNSTTKMPKDTQTHSRVYFMPIVDKVDCNIKKKVVYDWVAFGENGCKTKLSLCNANIEVKKETICGDCFRYECKCNKDNTGLSKIRNEDIDELFMMEHLDLFIPKFTRDNYLTMFNYSNGKGNFRNVPNGFYELPFCNKSMSSLNTDLYSTNHRIKGSGALCESRDYIHGHIAGNYGNCYYKDSGNINLRGNNTSQGYLLLEAVSFYRDSDGVTMIPNISSLREYLYGAINVKVYLDLWKNHKYRSYYEIYALHKSELSTLKATALLSLSNKAYTFHERYDILR